MASEPGSQIALAQAGASVAVNFRESADAAKTVCNEIRAMGRNAILIQANVSVSTDVKRMVKEVEHSLGGIDILVNNAAIASRASWKTSPRKNGTRYSQ